MLVCLCIGLSDYIEPYFLSSNILVASKKYGPTKRKVKSVQNGAASSMENRLDVNELRVSIIFSLEWICQPTSSGLRVKFSPNSQTQNWLKVVAQFKPTRFEV